MNPDPALCTACFTARTGAAACAACGYDEARYVPGPLVLPPGTRLAGQFLVGAVLGKPGGFGITYLGWDPRLELRVAIKEFLPRELATRGTDRASVVPIAEAEGELFRYGLDRFLAEARSLARFDHPNVMRVRTYFEANGTGYLVMDYYDGSTLSEYVANQGGRLDEEVALGIMLPVLDGLREVHAKGFIHRDIKPQNIYLTRSRRAILLDFGAARLAVGERSRSLSVVLTPGFAPYEQYHRSGRQGPWTDVYACAATLYQLLTGEVPADAPERVMEDPLVPPARIRPELSAHVSDAVMAGLAVRHEHRPQTIREFQDRLLSPTPRPGRPRRHEPRRVPDPVVPVGGGGDDGLGEAGKDPGGRPDAGGGRESDPAPAPAERPGWTRLDSWLAFGLASYVIAWFVQVVQGGVRLANGQLPGWEAYLYASGAIFEGSPDGFGWLLAALWFISAQTNLVLLLSTGLLIRWRFEPTGLDSWLRWSAGALWASSVINLTWTFFFWTDLRAGYLLWVTGFAVTAYVAGRHAAAARLAAAGAPAGRPTRGRKLAASAAGIVILVLAVVGYGTASRYIENRGDEPVWSRATGSSANAVALSPDGRWAASGHGDGSIRIWNVWSGIEVRALRGHDNAVTGLAFSPSGNELLSGGYDTTLRLWGVESGSEIRRWTAPSRVYSAALSPDGRLALSGTNAATLWNVATGIAVRTFQGAGGALAAVAFSPDGRQALSSSGDSTVTIWSVATGDEIQRLHHGGGVSSAAFSPNGRLILSGGYGGAIRLWDAASGRELWASTTDGVVGSVAFSADTRFAMSVGSRKLTLWDVTTGREVRTLRSPGLDFMYAAALSPDGRHAITGGSTVKLWELAPGR